MRIPPPVRRVRRGVLVLAVAAVSVALVAPTGTAQTSLASPVRIVGGPGHAFLYGWGVAASPNGRTMYISDYWNFEVKRFALDGTYLGPIARSTRGTGPGQHLSPYDVATAPGGDLYFGDVDANRTVDRYTAAGDFVGEFGGRGTGPGLYEYPSYVDVAADRRVFVVDSRQHHVTVNTPDGVEIFRFGGSGVERGKFRTPRGIAICRGCTVVRDQRADLVFVVDTRNARVQVFSYVPGASRVAFERAFGCSGARARCRFAPGLNLRGIAVDPERRRVYVVDAAGDDVDAFRFSGRPLFSFGGEGAGQGRFTDGGRDVDVDRRGRIWVGDLANFRAQVFSRDGTFLFQVPRDPAPPPLNGFNGPSDVAVSSSGVAYVVDTRNQRVVKWDVAGAASPVTAWGSRGKGSFGFNYPRAVAVDDAGRACPTAHCVYVADTDNSRIRKYTSTGKFLWRVGGSDTPEGSMKSWSLDVGPDGNLYVANGGRRKVSIVSPDGEVLREFGRPLPATGTPQPSQLGFPRGIDVAPDGTIWVADGERGDVQHFDEDGTYLGRVAPSGAGEDVLLLASDVKVRAGLLYVADARAHRIKVWTTGGDFVGSFGGGGSNLGRMFGPLGMDLVGDRLWVTESTGERVQEFQLNG